MINNIFSSIKDWAKFHNENKDNLNYLPLAQLFPYSVPRTYKDLKYPTNRVLDAFIREVMKNPNEWYIEAVCLWIELFKSTFSDDQEIDMEKSIAYNKLVNKYKEHTPANVTPNDDGNIEFKDYTYNEAVETIFYRGSKQNKFIEFLLMLLLMPIYILYKFIIFFASFAAFVIIVVTVVVIPLGTWTENWFIKNLDGLCNNAFICDHQSFDYIPLQLAFDAQKEIPYYIFVLYYKLLELFGGNIQDITFSSFYLFLTILILIIFSPICYFIYKFFNRILS